MTIDTLFLALAILDAVLVAAMVLAGLMIMEAVKKGQRSAQPAVQEAKALADIGKALANRAKTDGTAMTTRVKAVAGRVKQRVETTRRIAGELKPHGQSAAAAVRETGGDLARKARGARDLAQRLGRLKSAADAAVDAARNP
jgi:hypothetical protein